MNNRSRFKRKFLGVMDCNIIELKHGRYGNRGTPKSSILIGFSMVFHDKPCILGYPYFWKHPYASLSLKSRWF